MITHKMIEHIDLDFLEMYLKHNNYYYPEDKDTVSEGESGGSSEDHQERHLDRVHHHHQQQHHHYPHHNIRGNIIALIQILSRIRHLQGVLKMIIFILRNKEFVGHPVDACFA